LGDVQAVLRGEGRWAVEQADALDFLAALPEGSIDFVFFSPPYEAQRTYGIDFALQGQAWVDWMVRVFRAALRVCKGLVACVCEGFTRDFRWSATPALLMADLDRAGVHLRKPPAYRRVGIPGSGGPDWLRNDYEFIVCATNGGRLPWSDNTAAGAPPKYAPGGAPSHRTKDGTRVNSKQHTKRRADGKEHQTYTPPARANPGNVIQQLYTAEEVAALLGEQGDVVDCVVGGGRMGSDLASENEAPFPERLAEFFVRSFCPPGGVACDPFSGSGTTAAVTLKHGRRFVGCDVRASQVDLTRQRIAEALAALADLNERS
jgi:site-specific DNA-methyltransferase (cytosine-N4-specific)